MFGPGKILTTDSESALRSDEAARFADRHLIQLKPVPKYAHADLVERHHEIVRQIGHRVESECDAQGLGVPRTYATNLLGAPEGHSVYGMGAEQNSLRVPM